MRPRDVLIGAQESDDLIADLASQRASEEVMAPRRNGEAARQGPTRVAPQELLELVRVVVKGGAADRELGISPEGPSVLVPSGDRGDRHERVWTDGAAGLLDD